jgi:RND family efflux transporter MFP subunit
LLNAEQDVMLTAEIPGKVLKVLKDLGDRCRQGEPLVLLDPTSYKIAVSQAEAEIARTRTAADSASKALARVEALHERGSVADQQRDDAEAQSRTSAAASELAQAAVKLARHNLSQTVVRCPFSGSLAASLVDVGDAVAPQTPLARLVDGSRLHVLLSVTARELGRLKLGQAAQLWDPSNPDERATGNVARLGVAADRTTGTFPVEVALDGSSHGLLAGQIVEVTLELMTHTDVLAVPLAAVVDQGPRPFVYRIESGRAHQTPVQLGPEIDGLRVVTEGLAIGAQIVEFGASELKDGKAVEVVDRRQVAAALQHSSEDTSSNKESTAGMTDTASSSRAESSKR